MHVDRHRLWPLPERRCNRQRIVPERIPKGPAGGLGRIRATDIGPHAELKHQPFSCHRLTSAVGSSLMAQRAPASPANKFFASEANPVHARSFSLLLKTWTGTHVSCHRY